MNREVEELRISSDIKQANLEILRGRLEQAENCIREVAASLAWNCFGECRAVHDGPIMPAQGALEMARDFLASQQREQCQQCYGSGKVSDSDGCGVWHIDCPSCAQKHPEQAEGARGEQEVIRRLIAVIDGIDNDGCFKDIAEYNSAMEAARAALAQPSPSKSCTKPDCFPHCDCGSADDKAQPSPAPELERPEVVAWVQPISGMNEFFRTEAEAIAERADYLSSFEPEPEDLELRPEALVRLADFDRIVGALRAEEQRKDRLWQLETERAMRAEGELLTRTTELVAAQARVAELEKQEPVATVSADYDKPVSDIIDAYLPPGTKLYAGPVAQAWQVPEQYRVPDMPERGTQHGFSTTEQTCRHDFAGVWWADKGVVKTGKECRECGFLIEDAAAPAQGGE